MDTYISKKSHDLTELGKVKSDLRKRIERASNNREQMVEESARFLSPVNKQAEQSAQQVKKAVEEVKDAVVESTITLEDRIIRSALDKSNDKAFGIVPTVNSSEFVFGIAILFNRDFGANSQTSSMVINRMGVAVKDSNVSFPISNELLHVLTRNAKPQKASARDAFLKLVDLTIGLDLLRLGTSEGQSEASKDLKGAIIGNVKFRDLLKVRYGLTGIVESHSSGSGFSGDELSSRGSGDQRAHSPLEEHHNPYRRLLALLGSAQAGNAESNLKEFTDLLDKLLIAKMLNKKSYKILLKRFLK